MMITSGIGKGMEAKEGLTEEPKVWKGKEKEGGRREGRRWIKI
jgi:hypothetical protein